MIDVGLHLGDAALDRGYVDGIMNEEKLPEYLGIPKVSLWEEADGQVYLLERDFSQKYVAVIYAGGMIVDGESANPPGDTPIPLPFVGGERLGDITLNQQVRNLLQDPACGALVLYIDSGGGSASASESMASALAEFGKARPLVVYMGGVAASGGYYIATPGALDRGAVQHHHRFHRRGDGQAGQQRYVKEIALQRIFLLARG